VRLLKTVEGLSCFLRQGRWEGDNHAQLGFVPTMGGLHEGHLSLIQRARQENDVVIVSIFVNPLQFGPGEDLDRYPQTQEQDLQLCRAAGVDGVFMPTPRMLYGAETPTMDHLTEVIPPRAMMKVLCGPYRPGHFEGVATVVTKLLSLVRPDRAYFGQKDAQQLAIIKRLVADLNLTVEIVDCPIVREASGLALSSRNQYLTDEERQQAAVLYRGLTAAKELFNQGERSSQALIAAARQHISQVPQVMLQYVDVVHPDTLEPLQSIGSVGVMALAAHLGPTRLIDNMVLRHRKPIIAIDGPAGAGKSTVARRVAKALDLLYLDSGAMYRAITWLALDRGIDPQDEVGVAELLQGRDIKLASSGDAPEFAAYPSRIWIDDREVTQQIRTPEVTQQVSAIAAQPVVRKVLLQQQQQYGVNGGVVMEGRDIGTAVFPHAELKIFLTASVTERARRRQRDMEAQNQAVASLEDLERAIDERDRKDSTRKVAPLKKADDALELNTDGLTIDDVVSKIVCLFENQVASKEA
jgi:pantoate ligase/cytidylate kinase